MYVLLGVQPQPKAAVKLVKPALKCVLWANTCGLLVEAALKFLKYPKIRDGAILRLCEPFRSHQWLYPSVN
jgi:hypothetical protein